MINIGAVRGTSPVTGITLPLIVIEVPSSNNYFIINWDDLEY